MRNEIKRMEQAESADFMTGVGLYLPDPEPPLAFHEVDEDALLRNIRDTKYDDLAELRRMIKKTESNLREYSQSVSSSPRRSTTLRMKSSIWQTSTAGRSMWG